MVDIFPGTLFKDIGRSKSDFIFEKVFHKVENKCRKRNSWEISHVD